MSWGVPTVQDSFGFPVSQGPLFSPFPLEQGLWFSLCAWDAAHLPAPKCLKIESQALLCTVCSLQIMMFWSQGVSLLCSTFQSAPNSGRKDIIISYLSPSSTQQFDTLVLCPRLLINWGELASVQRQYTLMYYRFLRGRLLLLANSQWGTLFPISNSLRKNKGHMVSKIADGECVLFLNQCVFFHFLA